MIADEQTQRLPSGEDELETLREILRPFDLQEIRDVDLRAFPRWNGIIRACSNMRPGARRREGQSRLHRRDDDPETFETLERMGFKDARRAAETGARLAFRHQAAVQNRAGARSIDRTRAGLLESLRRLRRSGCALAAFDDALGHMPAAIELFSILRSNAMRDLFRRRSGRRAATRGHRQSRRMCSTP